MKGGGEERRGGGKEGRKEGRNRNKEGRIRRGGKEGISNEGNIEEGKKAMKEGR